MVLHKNKWDKRASGKHDKKLSEKSASAVAEERQKKEERAARRADIPRGVPRNIAASSLEPMRPRPPRAPVAANTKPAVGDLPPSSSDEDGEDEEEGGQSFRRRAKMQTNSWRYEEPEPEPGQELLEEGGPEPDYLSLTKEKLKSIQSREAKDADNAPLDIRDPDSYRAGGGRRNQKVDQWEKGKNVVVVPRDDFQDVTDKIAKQTAVDDFRQRFGTKIKRSGQADETRPGNEEDELDELIGGLKVQDKVSKSKLPIQAADPLDRIPKAIAGKKAFNTQDRTPRVIAGKKDSDAQDRIPKVIPGKKKDYEDDDWLDSRFGRR